MIKNGNQTEPEKNGKPKYSIHDFKPKKRYTRDEKEKIEAGVEFLEALRKAIEKDEQIKETIIG